MVVNLQCSFDTKVLHLSEIVCKGQALANVTMPCRHPTSATLLLNPSASDEILGQVRYASAWLASPIPWARGCVLPADL